MRCSGIPPAGSTVWNLENQDESRVAATLLPEAQAADEGLCVRRQRSEQNLTASQVWAHFLRQMKGRAHCTQILLGRLALATLCPLAFLRDLSLMTGLEHSPREIAS